MPMGLNLPPDRAEIERLRRELRTARESFTQATPPPKEGKKMGYALWCDQCQRSFSPKDPNMQEYSKKKRIGETMYDDETYTLCGPCATNFQPGRPTQTALEAQIAEAEHDLGMD